MHPLLDPKLDVVFKLIFARDHPDSRAALLGLLTAVIRPTAPLVSVEVLNPEIERDAIEDKDIVLDIRARLANGTTTNVEMQARNVAPFRDRFLYYWARGFSQQLGSGDGYKVLRPTISVALLSYREPRNPRFHSVFRLLEATDHAVYSDALELHLVQLPLLGELTEVDRLGEASLLRWTKFFAARSAEELDEAAMEDPAVSKARDILHRLSADPEARRIAEERERSQITRGIEHAASREEGRLEERRRTIGTLCGVMGIPFDERRATAVAAMDGDAFSALLTVLGTTRAWPSEGAE